MVIHFSSKPYSRLEMRLDKSFTSQEIEFLNEHRLLLIASEIKLLNQQYIEANI